MGWAISRHGHDCKIAERVTLAGKLLFLAIKSAVVAALVFSAIAGGLTLLGGGIPVVRLVGTALAFSLVTIIPNVLLLFSRRKELLQRPPLEEFQIGEEGTGHGFEVYAYSLLPFIVLGVAVPPAGVFLLIGIVLTFPLLSIVAICAGRYTVRALTKLVEEERRHD